MPFLYPCLSNSAPKSTLRFALRIHKALSHELRGKQFARNTSSASNVPASKETLDKERLNPAPSDYGRFIFQDRCTVALQTGSGGSGCISFLREKYISEGPANGGDGGSGGSIYIQAIEGQTSLHKLARRGAVKAGRGRNGKGKLQGGQRGNDVVIQVPVGTVVREIGRYDPVAEKELELRELRGRMPEEEALRIISSKREHWLLYPGAVASDYLTTDFPVLPPPQRLNIAAMQPPSPIHLDLSRHMEEPMLLAAGAVGGYGNPHFVSRETPRPIFATKGERGMKLELGFELKLLADVGLVGLPNAGKSTLLRSVTNSRARIGNWPFTTLSPNIGTVVLDDLKGRPLTRSKPGSKPRSRFTIADIPGLVENAHQDKGLGLGFLRHIERAGILAFVVDLNAGDAVQALKGLWRELDEYQNLREQQLNLETETRTAPAWGQVNDLDEPRIIEAYADEADSDFPGLPITQRRNLPELETQPVYTKPWFVIGTKADISDTQGNFRALEAYLSDVGKGAVEHPSRRENAWRERLHAIPVSAINAEGVNAIPQTVVDLLDGYQ